MTLDGMLDDTGEFRILQLLPDTDSRPGELAAHLLMVISAAAQEREAGLRQLADALTCGHAARRRRPLPPSSGLKRGVRVGLTADAQLLGYHIMVSDSHIVMPDPYRRDLLLVLWTLSAAVLLTCSVPGLSLCLTALSVCREIAGGDVHISGWLGSAHAFGASWAEDAPADAAGGTAPHT